MRHLIHSVESSIHTQNWYAALTLALTLPDIAAKIEFPQNNSSHKRYAAWFDKYLRHHYEVKFNFLPEKTVFLSGNDCYALRCSFLHEGVSEISHQRAQEILNNFTFVAPKPNSRIHRNRINNTLQLQADLFCIEIVNGIKAWLNDISQDVEKQNKMSSFLAIHSIR